MKIDTRLGPGYQIKCATCGTPLGHDIDEDLVTVEPCGVCLGVARQEAHEEAMTDFDTAIARIRQLEGIVRRQAA